MAGTDRPSQPRISFFSRKTFAVFSVVFVASALLFLVGFKPALAVILVGGFPGSAIGLMSYEFLLMKNTSYEPGLWSMMGFCALCYFGSYWFLGFAFREITARLGYKWSAKDEAAFGRDKVS